MPAPPKPKAPAVDAKAFRESVYTFRPADGNETVADIGGIVNAETQGMTDSKSENEPLSDARGKIAHVRINGIRKWGGRVDRHAGMARSNRSGPDYHASLEAATDAAIQDAQHVDPTGGATNYNMRTCMDNQRPLQGEDLQTQSGPYRSPTPYNVINTYGE